MAYLMEIDGREKINGFTKMSLSDQVKQYILDAIERGELTPGDRLVESKIARQFSISQAPVREAISELVSTGFLDREPNKGAVVRMLTDKDMIEIYTVRATLESLAAQQAVEHITDAHIHQLSAILEKMLEMARLQDFISTARYDRQFHDLIMEISGNRLLHRIYQNLQLGQFTLITMRRSTQTLEMLAQRHQKVIDALETREPENAKAAMWHHIEELQPQLPQQR